jgi:hypothetical protein
MALEARKTIICNSIRDAMKRYTVFESKISYEVKEIPEFVVHPFAASFEPVDSELVQKLQTTNTPEVYKQYEHLGFRYFPNFLSSKEEALLQKGLTKHAFKEGMKVEGSTHMIQRQGQRLAADVGIADKIRKAAQLEPQNDIIQDQGAFNYYQPNWRPGAHQDNLFHAKAVAVVSLGSPTTMTFQHWVTKKCFKVLLESRSLYVMEGLCRYEMTHGDPEIQQLSSKQIDEILDSPPRTCEFGGIKWQMQPRMSLVYGINVAHEKLFESPLQVYGESDQRIICEEWWADTLQKSPWMSNMLKLPPPPLNLLQYLKLLDLVVSVQKQHDKNPDWKTYFVPIKQKLEEMCVKQFGYQL